MKIKEGDIFKNLLNDVEYVAKKVMNKMVVLESQNGKSQVLTGTEILGIKSFYQKKEEAKS